MPLFRGRDNNDQLNQILRILGTPDEATLRRIATESVRSRAARSAGGIETDSTLHPTKPEIQLRPFPRMQRIPFSSLYPKAHPVGTSSH